MKVRDEDVLPVEVLRAMLNDVAPQPVGGAPVAAPARLKTRLMQRVARAVQAVARDAGWRPFLERTEMKILCDDGVTRSWLVRLRPGGELPPHDHDNGDEECVVLEGEVWLNGRRFVAGDYTVALRGSHHDCVRTETGAVIYLRSPSPRTAAARHACA